MSSFRRISRVFSGAALRTALSVVLSVAATLVSIHAHAGYAYRSDVQSFIKELEQKHRMDGQQLKRLFDQVQYQESAVRLMTPKPQKNDDKPSYVPWHQYKKRFVNAQRIRQGADFYTDYASALVRAEKTYGVPAEIIVAIIGVETSYGRNMGSYRVLDALATLAFDSPRRQEFFRKELEEFLLLVQEQKLDPLSLKGSYAGAMGYGQFMPSSYRQYAVDFDRDGRVDIWNNPVDAIGSVANYFKQHGWVSHAPVVTRATTAKIYDPSGANETREPHISIGALKKRGFQPYDQSLSDNMMVTLVELQGDFGVEYWLGLQNFYAITEYNHSRRYALAVYQLAQQIKSRQSS